MDLVTAAHYLKVGYRIRRAYWNGGYIDLSEPLVRLAPESLWADDWEVITEGVVKHFPFITYADELE